MKLLISISFSLFVFTHLLSCSFAVQNRIFPLGMTSAGVVVVEVRLDRGSAASLTDEKQNITNDELTWSGQSYLKVYDNNQRELYTEVIDSGLSIHYLMYDSILRSIVDKGLSLTTRFNDFKRITSGKINFCRYETPCDFAELIYDTINNTVHLKSHNGHKHLLPITNEEYTIANDIRNMYLDRDAGIQSITGLLLISSYREYNINEQRIFVAHIAVGQKLPVHDEKKEKKRQFSDVANSTFSEPVIYHSQGFDFVFWE